MPSRWIVCSVLCWILSTNCTSQNELPGQALSLPCLAPNIDLVYDNSSFDLNADIIVEEAVDDVYIVTISSKEGKYFEGFSLEARAQNDPAIPLGGYFSTQPSTRRNSCGPHINNTLMNEFGHQRRKLVVIWTPPTGFQGGVIFRAYIIEKPDLSGTFLNAIPNIIRKKSNVFQDNHTALPFSELPESMEEASKGCGSKRGCFGLPADCLDKQGSCEVLVSFAAQSDGVKFQLTGLTSKDVSWIAVGLSHDREMGYDSVTDCISLDSGKILVQQSWNYYYKKRNEVLKNPHEGIFNMKGKMSHGILTCTWTRRFHTLIHHFSFDLLREEWHLLLAKGPVKHGEKAKHHGAIASEKTYNLTSHSMVQNADEMGPVLENSLRNGEGAVGTYGKYLAVIRGQIERARREMSNAVRVLDEASGLKQASLIKKQRTN